MSNKLNAEELAAKRFPHFDGEPVPLVQRGYYAAAIREVAQPIADERDELVAEILKVWTEDNGSVQLHTPIAWYRVLSLAEAIAKYPKP